MMDMYSVAMATARTPVFRNNRTQAVRLPRDVAFPDTVKQVDVFTVGRARVVVPAGEGWEWFFEQGPRVPDDFMADRDQPLAQERDAL